MARPRNANNCREGVSRLEKPFIGDQEGCNNKTLHFKGHFSPSVVFNRRYYRILKVVIIFELFQRFTQ